MLELEKSSFQNNLDDVLELATQQKASFHEKYEEVNNLILFVKSSNMSSVVYILVNPKLCIFFACLQLQQNALVAQEQAKIANEKLSKQVLSYSLPVIAILLSSQMAYFGHLICFLF